MSPRVTTLLFFNRTTEKAEAWASEHGGNFAETPAEAAAGAEFVFSCVGNDDDLRSVTYGEDGILEGMAKGGIFIDHTTASAIVAREIGEKAKEKGIGFLDAPVSGGQAGAENGVLTVMCGGEQADFDRAAPVIDAYARAVTLLGLVGSGQLCKMVNQITVAAVIQGLAEGLNFGTRAGLDMKQVLDVISKGAATSWQMENRGETMLDDEFRLRLRCGLDAEGPGHLPCRGTGKRVGPAGDRTHRRILRRSSGNGRRPVGHDLPDQAPQPGMRFKGADGPVSAG